MKKISGLLLILMMFAATGNLFAGVRITITPPSVDTGGPIDTELVTQKTIFENYLLTTDLSKLGSQDKLATGFGNAVSYAAQSGSLAGYQGYDLFAIFYGITLSGQPLYVSPSDYSKIGDDIEKDKDADAGVGLSTSFNLGLNITMLKNMIGLDELLPNRMYMNIKYFTFTLDAGDYSFETTTFGVGLNYQLIDNGGDRFRLFKWSGLSVGTGFLYNTNQIDMTYTFGEYSSDPVDADPTAGVSNYYMAFSPETTFGLDISSYVIPFDISTSARLLWMFNFTLGAGFDFTFGESKIIANAGSPMEIRDSDDNSVFATGGNASIDGGTKGEPTIANFRLTGGLGLCLGPIPLDLSATWYPITSGISVNLSTGIVW